MDLIQRVKSHFEEGIAVKQVAANLLSAPAAAMVEVLVDSFMQSGKLLICGNGGSAADAQHLAAELVGRFEIERPAMAAIALTTDTSIMSAVGNDYGFDRIFARQVEALGQAQDVLLAISTSGNSSNVMAAIKAAHEQEMRVIAFTGKGGGKIADMLNVNDIHLCAPSDRTARIQEIHQVLLHALCDGVDALLSGENDV